MHPLQCSFVDRVQSEEKIMTIFQAAIMMNVILTFTTGIFLFKYYRLKECILGLSENIQLTDPTYMHLEIIINRAKLR